MKLTRREFQRRAGVALALSPVLSGIACGPGESDRSGGATPAKTAATGPLQMTLGPADVAVPASEPEGETWRYGIGLIVQVAPQKAAVLCNIKGKRGRDFEAGSDAFLFGDLSEIQASEAIPISRNHDEDNPNSSPAGKPAIMVKYPVRGGFVPLGAKLENGSPHPHAGTGFSFSQVIAWTADQKSTYPAGEAYHYAEVYQLAYDGDSFLVTETKRIPFDQLLEGALISNPGMTTAIPDGEDLLFAMAGGIQDGFGAGLTRWSRQSGTWRPASWVPITDSDRSFEASVIRDLDGSLLFSARAGRDQEGRRRLESRVWRSQDGGHSWTKTLHVVGAVGGCPITLNQAADGTPYIAANLNEVILHPLGERFRPQKNDQGIVYASARGREKLCLWPLNQARDGLEPPILVRDSVAEFGLAPSGDTWAVDHPSASTVQLADGNWHNLIGMRICDTAEVREGAAPAPQTGCYVEEVLSSGTPIPTWSL